MERTQRIYVSRPVNFHFNVQHSSGIIKPTTMKFFTRKSLFKGSTVLLEHFQMLAEETDRQTDITVRHDSVLFFSHYEIYRVEIITLTCTQWGFNSHFYYPNTPKQYPLKRNCTCFHGFTMFICVRRHI